MENMDYEGFLTTEFLMHSNTRSSKPTIIYQVKTRQSCRIHSFLDKAFNDLAWEKLESSEASPNNIDRNLLTDLLERIKDGYQKGLLKTSEYL